MTRNPQKWLLLPTRRQALCSGMILSSALAAGGFVLGQADSSEDQPSGGFILREGTQVDSRTAICRSSGDRLILEIDNFPKQIVALENLSAQRVMEALYTDPNDRYWSITGTITEFRGSNFMLLQKVNRDSRRK